MIDLLRPFRALAAAVRRWLMHRAARRLLGENLPRGLPPPARPFTLALRVPQPFEAPEGEYWTLPLGAQAVRGRGPARLFRLAALPRPPRKLDVAKDLSPRGPILAGRRLQHLQHLQLLQDLQVLQQLESRVRDLGVARPSHFRLDADLRLPPEVDPLRLASDAPPPAPPRRVRPRTPLARAPVHRLRRRNFRLDPRTGRGPNEGILPLQPRDTSYQWVSPSFRREKIDLHWMARERNRFLGPTPSEWFAMWWLAVLNRKPGARDPRDVEQPIEIAFAVLECKEQMLIRRDVKKDGTGPETAEEYLRPGLKPAMQPPERRDLAKLIPPKIWVDIDHDLDPLPFDRGQQEAYLMWRTLVNALEER